MEQLTHLDMTDSYFSVPNLSCLHKFLRLKQLALGYFNELSELWRLVGPPITTIRIDFPCEEQQSVASFLQEAAGGLERELMLVTPDAMEAMLLPLEKAAQLRSLPSGMCIHGVWLAVVYIAFGSAMWAMVF